MLNKFIAEKFELLTKDNQSVFTGMVNPLSKQIENAPEKSSFEVPVDGNWFKLSFTALEIKKDRLVRLGKTPAEIEKDWSKGMMEKLGYKYVEALDTGPKKGAWQGASVHWHKLEQDKLL